MKFKVGDRVRCNGGYTFDESVGTIQSINGPVYEVKIYTANGDGFMSPLNWTPNSWCYFEKHLELIINNMKYKQGDILIKGNSKRKILGVCGETYIVSLINNFDVYGGGATQKELDDYGYKLKDSDKEEWIKKGEQNGWVDDGKVVK